MGFSDLPGNINVTANCPLAEEAAKIFRRQGLHGSTVHRRLVPARIDKALSIAYLDTE